MSAEYLDMNQPEHSTRPEGRPLFLQVNVYRNQGSWFVSWGRRRAGGPYPRTLGRDSTLRLPADTHTWQEAMRAAAYALSAEAENPRP